MSAIIVKNLCKYFPSPKNGKRLKTNENMLQDEKGFIKAVDGINFEVKKGEIFGFLGPNGAGKTTSIRMMTGVLRPTKGSIEIFGLDAWKYQIKIKQRIGNVPEMANVYMEYSGWENLMFIGEIYGIKKNIRVKNAEILLKKFNLFEKRNLKAGKYSKGMKQRLLLCMSLMNDPDILFLDEPTSGLDVQSAKIIKQLIREYNKKGVTIFLTTHDLEVANDLCDRIAIINHGKIICLDTPYNIRKLTQEFQAIDINFENGIDIHIIENLQSVISIQKNETGFHIIVEDIHQAICEMIDLIKDKNIILKQINTHEPKLEEAFLKLIQRGDTNE